MPSAPTTVLLACADREAADPLEQLLRAAGLEPLQARTPEQALSCLAAERPDLAVVWLQLPDSVAALALIRRIRDGDGPRAIDAATPLLALDPQASEFNCLLALEQGCDDYLADPYSPLELRARLTALLRRSRRQHGNGCLELAGLEIDSLAQQARLDGSPLALSPTEFALLRELASEPRRVFTKAELLRNVWGYRSLTLSRTVDIHACRLRRKLAAAEAPLSVQTVRGVGYRLAKTDPA